MGAGQGVHYEPPDPAVPRSSRTCLAVLLDYPEDRCEVESPFDEVVTPPTTSLTRLG